MGEFWWEWPVLRGLSPMNRGFVEALAVVLIASALGGFGINWLFSDPTGQLCGSLAQVGATLLVAYALQIGWVLENSRKRGVNRENWVGLTMGLACSALVGIGIALALSTRSGALDLAQGFGFAWTVVSVAMLGVSVALAPWAMYHWTHSFNTEYPDE
jgi:hypothetical protein